ncbi:PQQ-binding-like beta-propeller repeat protein [Streptomyces sp. KLOTTS4A1]|uniref:outer membrane protein assembly factor BamB family protein n=1 Tax=Streptomyces sp. KLOTTS4A1 TaxID=3390996 RepID=UPI0039F61553
MTSPHGPQTPPAPRAHEHPVPSAYTQSQLASEAAGRRRRRTVLSAGLALALVAGLAATAWLLWPTSESGQPPKAAGNPGGLYRPATVAQPQGVEGSVAYPMYTPELPDESPLMELPGAWAKGKTFAKTTPRGIDGYQGTSPDPVWQIKTRKDICGASRDLTADGLGVILYRDNDPGPDWKLDTPPCNNIGVFDIDTGKPVWDAEFDSAAETAKNLRYSENLPVAVSDGVVAVPWGRGSIAYDIHSGKKVWANSATDGCSDWAYAGGETILALVYCGSYENTSTYIQAIDPHSGKREWSYGLARDINLAWVLSVDPPAIAVSAGEGAVDPTNVITIDGQGNKKSSITLPTDRYDLGCEGIGLMQPCRTAPVIDGRLYLPTMPDEDTHENSVIEFDLPTGGMKRKYDSKPGRPFYPLRRNGDDLMVYNAGMGPLRLHNIGTSVNSIESLNLDTAKTSPYMVLPYTKDSELLINVDSDILIEGGRVYFVLPTVYAPEKDGPKFTWYGVAFEAKG